MPVRTEESYLENFSKIVIAARVICVGGALSVMAFLVGRGLETRDALLVSGLLFFVFPLSVIWWLLQKSGRDPRQVVLAQLAADAGLATGIVYYTGGIESHLSILYFVAILLASVALSMRGALVVATLSAALYASASLLEQAREGAAVAGAPGQPATAYLLLNIGLQIGFFYFAAILSGYLSRRMGVFGARLRSTTKELQRIRTDTHSIIESMSSGFVIVDPDGTINDFNRAASGMLGVPAGDAIGKKAQDVIAPISLDLWRKIVDGLALGREEERGEARVITPDGAEVPLGVSVSLLKDEDSRAGVVLIFQDLTDVKRMTERVRLADRLAALGELSAAIAHEIRTPLASISGSVEMLRDSFEVQGENRRLVDLVVKESERLKSIIDHFLEFARQKPSRMKDVILNSVLTEVVYLVKNHPSFKETIRVEVETPGLVEAYLDEETIKQVFYNLALNAIEALPSGGKLKVSLGSCSRGGKEFAVVAFEDNGVGIDKADLEQIFEPFFTRKKAGTGLGLAISSKIVQEHGGTIEIRSNKGSGTTATVYLPVDRSRDSRIHCGSESTHALVGSAK